MSVKILTDSTSYIDENIIKALDIRTVSLSVLFNDSSYKETEISNDVFYKMMDEKGIPTSSQPSIEELYKEMKEVVEKGHSLLGVFISSDMSGAYSTANLVKNMILEEYKDAKIEIVDSRSNCMQLGYAAIAGAKAAKLGKSLSEVKQEVENVVKRSRFLFIPENLDYLKKGGRIGGASALIGNLLKIIPILTVEDGKTTVFTKVRTKKKAILTMIDKVIDDITKFGLVEMLVHNINCLDEAKEVASKLVDILNINIPIGDIGPVIGLHVGPGAIGIVYYTEKDMR